MRILAVLLSISFFLAGCARSKTANQPVPAVSLSGTQPALVDTARGIVVTSDNSLSGKVVKVNSPGRFVVLNFPVSKMPSVNQRLYVYRGNLRVGELNVSGPQMDDNVAADILSGEASVGDQVRDQ